jgi:hypothetical protein
MFRGAGLDFFLGGGISYARRKSNPELSNRYSSLRSPLLIQSGSYL